MHTWLDFRHTWVWTFDGTRLESGEQWSGRISSKLKSCSTPMLKEENCEGHARISFRQVLREDCALPGCATAIFLSPSQAMRSKGYLEFVNSLGVSRIFAYVSVTVTRPIPRNPEERIWSWRCDFKGLRNTQVKWLVLHEHQPENTDRLGLEYELEDPPRMMIGDAHERHYWWYCTGTMVCLRQKQQASELAVRSLCVELLT